MNQTLVQDEAPWDEPLAVGSRFHAENLIFKAYKDAPGLSMFHVEALRAMARLAAGSLPVEG